MIGLLDYGMGNLQSVRNACEYLGHSVKLVRSGAELDGLDKAILPGVGSFAEGMKSLKASGLADGLRRRAADEKFSLLGICLGMQLLADRGMEGGDTEGLGLIPGVVERLDDRNVRLPHIGWNNIDVRKPGSVLRQDLAVDFYFVHSYYFRASEVSDIAAVCDYGMTFPCAVERGRILGVQFHPEKSHRFGLELLKRFLDRSC